MLKDSMNSRFNHQSVGWRKWVANASFHSSKLHILESWQRQIKYFFSLFALISFLAVLVGNSITPVVAQIPLPEIRGVWITENDFNTLKDRTKVQDAVTQLQQLNFNTIYPVVWNSGYVMYPSAVAKREGIQPFVLRGADGHDILPDIVNQAHRHQLLVIPWFEFGFMAPPTSELALNHPEWLTQKRDGSQISDSSDGDVVWLNPFHPQVQQFITDLLLELVTEYDVDGVQFDDHMSLPREFGYDKYTVALYNQETMTNPPSNPEDQAWMRWRADKITAFMVQLNQTLKSRKQSTIFSVSPNYYDFAYKFHLQDWLKWVRLNIVDELVMQVYRSNYQSFVEIISRPEIQETQQRIPTGIGIMAGLRNNPVPIQQVKYQARAAQQRGLGVSFFYYESLWNDAPEPAPKRQAEFKSLFSFPALRVRIQ